MIELEVAEDNVVAEKLYLSEGFIFAGKKDNMRRMHYQAPQSSGAGVTRPPSERTG